MQPGQWEDFNMGNDDKTLQLAPIQLDACRSLRELVVEKLRTAIQTGVLKPGQRLMEIQLAESLGVSRTPVREAVRELEMDGFVIMIPRRGTYVADISLKDITQVFEIRTTMEELAASLAAARITQDELAELEGILAEGFTYIRAEDMAEFLKADVHFHHILYKASRNKWLIEIIENLQEHLMRFRSISTLYPGRLAQTWDEHRQLVEAIAAHNIEKARKVASMHMANAEKTLLKEIEQDETSARKIREGAEAEAKHSIQKV